MACPILISFATRRLAHSFAELFGGNQAVDRVRGQQVPKTGPTLDYLGKLPLPHPFLAADLCMCLSVPSPADEAFTSENWIVSLTPKHRRMRRARRLTGPCDMLGYAGPNLPGQEGGSARPRLEVGERVRARQEEEEVQAAREAESDCLERGRSSRICLFVITRLLPQLLSCHRPRRLAQDHRITLRFAVLTQFAVAVKFAELLGLVNSSACRAALARET